jgi:hypothetical protein
MTVVALIPELDDYVRPAQAVQRFAPALDIRVEAVAGAKHLWVGEKYVYLVLNRVVELVATTHAPLATEWDGPMQRWTDF